MSSISINAMSLSYNNYPKSNEIKNNFVVEQGFADKVKQMAENRVAEVSKTKTMSTKDMTPEEYKQYIHNEISKIPLHPSRALESISLNISDAGFKAMQNDPEYEAWVLNDLRVGWSQSNPWTAICGGSFSTIYYGATKEECHAESWYPSYGNGEKLFNQKAEDSFWERRSERKKKLQENYDEQQEQIHRNQKYFDERTIQYKKVNDAMSTRVIESYDANVLIVSPDTILS